MNTEGRGQGAGADTGPCETHICIASSSVHQIMFVYLFLSLSFSLSPALKSSIPSRQGPFVEAVTMYSWLVTALLLATTTNGRGQGAGGGWGWDGRKCCSVLV